MTGEGPQGTALMHQGLESSLRGLVLRLLELLEREGGDLRAGRLEALEEHARQKDLLLVDLARLSALVRDPSALSPALREDMKRLRAALDENRALIARHLKAAREFAAFVEDTIRRRSTDGTYSRRAVRGSAGRAGGDGGEQGAAARVKKAYGKW
jgi:hypothetical protein